MPEQLRNRGLQTQLEACEEKFNRVRVDAATMEAMKSVLKSLDNKPDAVRTLAAMRAAMQVQVKELAAQWKKSEDDLRTIVANQSSMAASLHEYIDKLSHQHGVDTSDRPGVCARAAGPLLFIAGVLSVCVCVCARLRACVCPVSRVQAALGRRPGWRLCCIAQWAARLSFAPCASPSLTANSPRLAPLWPPSLHRALSGAVRLQLLRRHTLLLTASHTHTQGCTHTQGRTHT